MKFEERKYQTVTVNKWYDALKEGHHAIVAVPTGAGKTVILCQLIEKWLEDNPDDKIIVLSHTEEIIKQDYESLLEFFPPFGVGVYSAGLKRKEVKKITVASIQSIYKKDYLFADYDLIIVDEAHTINAKQSKGMYRTFIESIGCQVGGMSATIFRTGQGYIHKGNEALFNKLAYDLTSIDNFRKLIRLGYLSNLYAQPSEIQLDTTNVKKSAGDYNMKHLAEKNVKVGLTAQAVKDLVETAKNYKKWLIFAIDINHCEMIHYELSVIHGIKCDFMHSRMDDDRKTIIDNFKYGDTQALVSVGMITTGFDAPNVDCIAVMRPTLSPVLHVQMIGRGLRIAPNKDHCLVLDYSGNIERLGPIDSPTVKTKAEQKQDRKNGKDEDELVKAKKCPKCRTYNHPAARVCIRSDCGHKFPIRQTKIKNTYQKNVSVLSEDKPDPWYDVDDVKYTIHSKTGKPDSLKVTYICGAQVFHDWICLDHGGWAGQKARKWVENRLGFSHGLDVPTLYSMADSLRIPKQILVEKNKRFVQVKNARF